MEIIKYIFESINLSAIFSIIAIIISVIALNNHTKIDYKKKQLETLTELIKSLHNEYFNISIVKYSVSGGSSSTIYTINLFEIDNLIKLKYNWFEAYMKDRVLFKGNSNQIANIKKFIDDPFLPKNVADELMKFYSIPPTLYIKTIGLEIDQTYIEIESKYFENNIYENSEKSFNLRVLNGFAFKTLTNMVECSISLENSIIKWFKDNNVNELNIRKDYKNI